MKTTEFLWKCLNDDTAINVCDDVGLIKYQGSLGNLPYFIVAGTKLSHYEIIQNELWITIEK